MPCVLYMLLSRKLMLAMSKFPAKGSSLVHPAWEPPPAGWIKFNVDGSYVPQSGEAAIGVVARDSRGQVILTAWLVLFRCQDAIKAEAQACLEGVRLAAQWSHGRVIIESDCARVIQSMKDAVDRSMISFTVAEAKDQASLLVEWRVAK